MASGVGPSEAPPGVLEGRAYRPALTQIQDPARTLLETWSGIPGDKLVDHVNDLIPYPSIGLFAFLDLDLQLCPYYAEVLERVKSGHGFLDLGCCFAQEVRLLVSEGAPAQNVYGADMVAEFIDQGYDLFLDKDKLNVKFFTYDIFSPAPSSLATELGGHLDIIHASNFFHLWQWDKQLEGARIVTKLLAERPGSMIIGAQVGTKRARDLQLPVLNSSLFLHSTRSFKTMWENVSQDTGIRFDIQVTETSFSDQKAYGWPDELETLRLIFTVRIV
ncbi:uncharacterized protein N7459_009013 [Penicillium hispanicum]|uniref:uncharacterized protein n=1 Tax=Penicillium hispanicum TaxID=1080232 RepID=UPI00254128D3|nr:uncharacterized protein N7459_009013 [Penicillium hispanicum]KAJ5569583.1 hypothetical protein N7459_009013 [Penicillium hispanicum]